MSTVVIAAFGSRGDVAPFTGLGRRLHQAGHQVAIAACARYAELIGDAGLEFRLLPGDPEPETPTDGMRKYFEEGHSHRTRKAIVPDLIEGMRPVGPAITKAAEDADILLTSVAATLPGYHVGQGLGIPTVGVFLLPTTPTGDFPPAVLGLRSMGRRGNRLIGQVAGLGERIFLPQINDLRRDLGLPPTTVRAIHREQHERRWPILHGFSQHVVPRPSDWRPGLELTGYWWPHPQSSWTPPDDLLDFLAAGPPPVYFGYGTGGIGQGERLAELTVAAARKAGVRAVVSGLDVHGDDVISVGNASFEWLFPRMAALVHHGGAGTTAIGIRAGVPAVTTPVIVDQHFWGRRLVQLGVSPDSIRYKDLSVDRLAVAIQDVLHDPSYRAGTRALSTKITAEDGAAPVIDLVDRLASAKV
ncbi:MAG TPA: glycosyltransferase [Pseudonocardiaceae bacterium]|nr:glycosyltransferase [Pseudonocardiaceae bacterium]